MQIINGNCEASDPKRYGTEDLPAIPEQIQRLSKVQLIAQYIEALLLPKAKRESFDQAVAIILPSVLALRSFFKCDQFQVLEALRILRSQGFTYTTEHLEAEITIHRPGLINPLSTRRRFWSSESQLAIQSRNARQQGITDVFKLTQTQPQSVII